MSCTLAGPYSFFIQMQPLFIFSDSLLRIMMKLARKKDFKHQMVNVLPFNTAILKEKH